MSIYLIKYIFIIFLSFFLYTKLLNINISFYITRILICSFIFTTASVYYRLNNPLFSALLSYTLFFIMILLCFHTKIKLGFFVSLISFGLSHAFFIISGTIYSLILYYLINSAPDQPNFFTFLCSGIISSFIIYFLFRSKRIQKGIKYIYTPILINIVSVVGVFMIISLTIIQLFSSPDNRIKLIPFYIVIVALIFFFLWQRQIKRYYNSKLRKLELESLRQELEEKNATIRKLSDDNDSLARIIHKDNKLIPAMLTAVTEYLDPENMRADAEREAQGKALADQLKELAKDRMGILGESTHTDRTLPLTGHAAVDAMLSYMKKRADMAGIRYEVKLHPDFASRIGPEISEADLSHLLSDLIENAIIATNSAEHKSLLVHLGILYDAPTVEVSDSGIPFAPEVYQDFGLQKHSTHLVEGGSGIGLMDIWELKKKYAASLHIYEYPPETAPFTKKLSMVFDHKKHYLIRSYRPEEIVKLQARSDLYILPLQEDTH